MKKKPRLKNTAKARIILIVAVLLSITFVPKSHRKAIKLYFSDGCVDRYQQIYSNKLNDRIVDYIDQSKTSGIEPCDDQNDITTLFVTGELSKIRAGRRYLFGDMDNSYPYLTRDSKKLLNEISRRFRKNLREDNLWRTKFIITSMTRTTENVKNLSASNINVSENSPHMYGNARHILFQFQNRQITYHGVRQMVPEGGFGRGYIRIEGRKEMLGDLRKIPRLLPCCLSMTRCDPNHINYAKLSQNPAGEPE